MKCARMHSLQAVSKLLIIYCLPPRPSFTTTLLCRRPLKMWASSHHIVSMLIMSTSQTETFFDELFQLTVRHIRYGVKSHYMPPFGKALIETFEESWRGMD